MALLTLIPFLNSVGATNRLYQSDTFESTSLDDFSSTYSTTTSLRRDPPTFTCNTRDMKERAYIDTSSLVSEHCSRTHSLVGAEVFLTQKLELLQAKLHTTKTQTNSKTLTQASTLGSLPLSISENTYIKACLNRLKSVPVDNNTDCSRVSYRRVDTTLDNGMVRVFSRQCERLKRESLKSRMKSEIKVGHVK